MTKGCVITTIYGAVAFCRDAADAVGGGGMLGYGDNTWQIGGFWSPAIRTEVWAESLTGEQSGVGEACVVGRRNWVRAVFIGCGDVEIYEA